MKKILLFLLMGCMIIGLFGCSSSKPDAVVEAYCDAVKAFDIEATKVYMENSEADSENDTEAEESFTDEQIVNFLKKCASEMKYEIIETTINGEEAVVLVEFDYIDASSVMQATLTEYISQAIVLAFSGADDTTIENLLGTIFSEKANEIATGTDNETITFNCVKLDGEWKIADFVEEDSNKLSKVLSCNIVEVFEEFDNGEEASDSNNEGDRVWHDVPAGETVELSTLNMCVIGCTEKDKLSAGFYEDDVAQEGTKFVVIEFKVENTTKSTMSFDNTIMLTDNEGREYSDYSGALWYYDETFSYTELALNIPLTGYLVYNVPIDSTDYYLSVGKSGTNEIYRLFVN